MKLLVQSILTISTSFIAYLLGYFFIQPNIEYFNDDYCQKVAGISIGTIYLINNGRAADENIAITFGMEITPENLNVSFLTSNYSVKNVNQHTVVQIDKLNPGEDAEITFKTKELMDKFYIENFTSKSGNITEVRDILLPWWHLSAYQVQLLISLLLGFATLGFYVAMKVYSSEDTKKTSKDPIGYIKS